MLAFPNMRQLIGTVFACQKKLFNLGWDPLLLSMKGLGRGFPQA
jgi:hypothetical protein